jgi:hypothetical protein
VWHGRQREERVARLLFKCSIGEAGSLSPIFPQAGEKLDGILRHPEPGLHARGRARKQLTHNYLLKNTLE